MCKIKSQDSLKTDLLMLPHKRVYTHQHLSKQDYISTDILLIMWLVRFL